MKFMEKNGEKHMEFMDVEINDTFENGVGAYTQFLKDSVGKDGMVELPIADFNWLLRAKR